MTVVILAGFSSNEKITVMGIVNDQYQVLSDDDNVYILGNGDQDDALAIAMGKRVVLGWNGL